MTWKQLLIGIIIVSVVLSLLMLGLIGVIKYRPDLLGIKEQIDTAKITQNQKPKKIQPLKPVYIEPTVHISQKQLAFFEKEAILKNELMIKNDSLLKLEKFLRDSIKTIFETIRFYQDSTKRANFVAENAIKKQQNISDSLNRLQNELSKLKARLELAERRKEQYQKMLENKVDSVSKINFETFAKIYENSKPQEVAAILERIDERDAARILKLMNRKKAGKIIEAMKPENAAAILLLGAVQ